MSRRSPPLEDWIHGNPRRHLHKSSGTVVHRPQADPGSPEGNLGLGLGGPGLAATGINPQQARAGGVSEPRPWASRYITISPTSNTSQHIRAARASHDAETLSSPCTAPHTQPSSPRGGMTRDAASGLGEDLGLQTQMSLVSLCGSVALWQSVSQVVPSQASTELLHACILRETDLCLRQPTTAPTAPPGIAVLAAA